MKFLVCIKQVGDNGDMNRFDENALEQALLLKEQNDDPISEPSFVDVVTIGPPGAEKIIKRAFGMGADTGYHIVTKDSGYVSSFITASRLAAVAEKSSYDLILTGIMSEDMMAGETGPMLAQIMGFPCATGVVKTSLHFNDNRIEVEREMENGFRDCLLIRLPFVLTIQAGINIPRYPCLSNMLAADKKQIITYTEAELFPGTVPGARQFCMGMEDPRKTRTGHLLEGSLSDKARQVLSFLREKNLV
mgnify:CR=1 FL=1